MKLSTVFLAAAIGSATSFAGAQLSTDAGAPKPRPVYDTALGTWVLGSNARPTPGAEAPPVVAKGTSSGSAVIIHSFGFPSGWAYVRDAAWDGSYLWIGENLNSRLYKIDPVSGAVISSFFGPSSNPWGLAWSGTDLLSATTTRYHSPPGDTLPDWVYRVTTSGVKLYSWEAPDSPDASPNGAAYDPVTGSLWLSDSYYDTIYETDPANGAVLSSFAFPGSEPLGLTWDGAYLYAIDKGSLSVMRLDTYGNVIDTASIASLGNDPQGLTWDGQYFWVTENATDTIYQVDLGFEPGVPFCFGDPGSGTPCPCGNDNDGSVPGSGCANGFFASGAQLTASGVPSVSADTLVLATTGQEPSDNGLYFQANNDLSPGLPWGDGLRCAGGGLIRLGVRIADGSGYSDTSGYGYTISGRSATFGHPIAAGETLYYQCWYRNPNGSPCAFDFNTSNGYTITWAP